MSVSTMTSWGFNYVTASLYLQVTDGPIGKFCTFIVFPVCCLSAFAFTYRFVPETKDVPLERCVEMVKLGQYTPVTGGEV